MRNQTLADLLTTLARGLAQRPAVADESKRFTFGDLDALASRWASALRAHQVGLGVHVGLLAPNGGDWLAVAFGVWRAGATLVPISTFTTARELAEVLDHADIEILIAHPGMRGRDFHALIETAGAPRRHTVMLGDHDSPYSSARDFLSRATSAPEVSVAAENPACILYTSGTTGRPKGVVLSHRSILATVGPTAERSGLGCSDSLLSSLPLFWVAGLVIRALPTLAAGTTLLLMESFTPEAAIAALEAHQPTALHLRPPQVGQLLAHPSFRRELLSRVRKGNGRVEWFDGQLPEEARFITGYGMTEMSGYVTALDWRDPAHWRRERIGTPLPGVEMKVADAEGRRCPAGTTGEILVRGPGMFSGYHKEPAGTGLDPDGWFRTGDLGSIDGGGVFRFSGRSKDLLRVKGINVSPLEVEAVLAAHPSVEAAYVIGLPPDGLDQKLVAIIVAAAQVAEAELRQYAARELSSYKRPEAYVRLRREDIPLGQTSKPQRAALAAIASARLGIEGRQGS